MRHHDHPIPSLSPDSFPILEQYMNYMQAVRERSPLTMKEYRYDLVMFFRFLLRDRGMVPPATNFQEISIRSVDESFLSGISTDDLFVFLIYLSRERKASPATRARKAATLKSFFKYLYVKRKVIPSDPSYELDSPKIARRIPHYLSLDESITLLDTASAVDTDSRERDYLMLTLFLNCGMRLSELAGINLHDIHENTLTVVGKGNKERTIYLNGACMHALQSYLDVRPKEGLHDPQALFISRIKRRISNQMVQAVVKRLLKEAGIDTRVYSVHKLRHTAATLMYKYGQVDIRSLQTILGHSSVSTTQIYTHVDDALLHAAVEKNPLADITAGKSSPKSQSLP
jgi:site-specific recombinase XerD